jgi:hypothetical protein
MSSGRSAGTKRMSGGGGSPWASSTTAVEQCTEYARRRISEVVEDGTRAALQELGTSVVDGFGPVVGDRCSGRWRGGSARSCAREE